MERIFTQLPLTLFLQEYIPKNVLSGEGALSRSDPFSGQSESWPDRGAPERPTKAGGRRWSAGRRSALRRRARAVQCTARGGSVNPASKGASQALWRLPPLHRPRVLCEGNWQSSDALRRENAEGWLFESVNRKSSKTAQHTRVIRGLDPRIHHPSQESFEEDGLPGLRLAEAASAAQAGQARQ
jgi:hypothetical protein